MSENKEVIAQENEHQTREYGDEEVAPHLHTKTYLVLLSMFLLSFVGVLQLTASGAYSSVVASVVGGADKASWMVAGILLPMVVLAVPVSQAADYWGRKWFLIVLNAMGAIGALITSRANSMNMVIAGQVIIGPAFATTALCFAVVSEVLPHRHRMSAQATLSLGNGLGGVAGLTGGASLIQTHGPEGFRILWYIAAGLFALASVICYFCYNPPLRELQSTLTLKEKLHSLDWIGGALLGTGLTLLCIAFSWANNPYPYDTTHVLAPLCISIVLLALFGVYEWKFKTDGMMNHRLFAQDRNLAVALVGIFLEGLAFVAANNFLAFQVSVLYVTRPILIGVNFSVSWIAYIFACIAAAMICYRFKQLKLVAAAGFMFFTIFYICMATTTLNSNRSVWGFPVFFGAGLACSLNALIAAAQFSAPPDLISTTSGLMAASRGVGATIGTAICISIFSSRLSTLLPERIANAVIPLGLPTSSLPDLIHALVAHDMESLADVPGATPDIIQAAVTGMNSAYLGSFRNVWITAAALSGAGALTALCIKDIKENFNQQIDAPAESEEALYGEKVRPAV
ncbi:hypothetical protein B0A52_00274 [Exophiala mesophila]|uniref:Major facilitator superfamily (MFS) profile domain-containing protein n=1 Tax=Exophiala mesophila TaxID=212818 RepID=A0A438NJK6_EXOME|nr:hypothetical protein B0A52_00274 [Exophiala mesophila]